jgi:hypothetical protein
MPALLVPPEDIGVAFVVAGWLPPQPVEREIANIRKATKPAKNALFMVSSET